MEKNERYRFLAKEMKNLAEAMGDVPFIHERKIALLDGAAAIEELLEKDEKQGNVIRVDTPLGAIIARPSDYGEEYPGLFVDLRRTDADQDLLLALVEFTKDEGGYPEGEGHIITRVYRDAMKDEYSDRIVHERIEDYFKME